MSTTNFNRIEDFLKVANKGAFTNVVTFTIPKMNKSAIYFGRVQKVTIYGSVKFGLDYSKLMKTLANKNGISQTEKYQVETNTGKGLWVDGLENIVTENDKGQRYFHLYLDKHSKITTYYLLDGDTYISKEMPLFDKIYSEDYASRKVNEPCDKQKAYGVGDKGYVRKITLKLENVKEIKQGAKSFSLLRSVLI